MTIVIDVEDEAPRAGHEAAQQADQRDQDPRARPGSAVERELMLVKVRAVGRRPARIMEIADVFRVNVVDVTQNDDDPRGVGQTEKLEALLGLLRDFAWSSSRGTGRIALGRGDSGIKDPPAQGRERRVGPLTPVERRDPMATIYYEKGHRPWRTERSEDRRTRVRHAGTCPRREPPGQWVRRARRLRAGVREPREG
jgi:acetolactate synthase-1/3 small subunit